MCSPPTACPSIPRPGAPQGDVESLASKNEKALQAHLEVVCGSAEYKCVTPMVALRRRLWPCGALSAGWLGSSAL
jgi:hypothetical protein